MDTGLGIGSQGAGVERRFHYNDIRINFKKGPFPT